MSTKLPQCAAAPSRPPDSMGLTPWGRAQTGTNPPCCGDIYHFDLSYWAFQNVRGVQTSHLQRLHLWPCVVCERPCARLGAAVCTSACLHVTAPCVLYRPFARVQSAEGCELEHPVSGVVMLGPTSRRPCAGDTTRCGPERARKAPARRAARAPAVRHDDA